jgi:lupus La protein
MADTENTAAQATNPTDVSKPESAVEVKTETSDSKPEQKAAKGDDGEEKWELNGKSEDKSDRRDNRNGRSNRDNDRRDGGRGRGQGRGRGGNFKNDRNKRCAHCFSFRLPVLTSYRNNNREFDNLPDSDDPSEIRSQV